MVGGFTIVEALATATEMKNQFEKYLQMVINGNEVIVTKNRQEVGSFLNKANYDTEKSLPR